MNLCEKMNAGDQGTQIRWACMVKVEMKVVMYCSFLSTTMVAANDAIARFNCEILDAVGFSCLAPPAHVGFTCPRWLHLKACGLNNGCGHDL